VEKTDAIVVGGGHNGLVAAAMLARQGLSVRVLEARDVLGGATRTEYPFEKAPGLGTSSGAYLLGLMPPELLQALDVEIPVIRRDPHYFLPTTDERYLLFGSDQTAMKSQFERFFSTADWEAHERLQTELAAIREDIAPTWMQAPVSIEETAERYVRPGLREAFVDLCRGSVGDYLARFGFESDLVKAMYAVTDGFSGLYATYDTPGTGMNFLIHNMCRLPGSDGTWMVVEGGMGTIVDRFAAAAKAHGAELETNAPVERIVIEGGVARGVQIADGRELRAEVILIGADPYQMQKMVGPDELPDDYNEMLDVRRRDGSTFKLNLALGGLPEFTCLDGQGDVGQYNGTIHLLPPEDVVIERLISAFDDVQQGQLPEFPSIEWYIHTTVDPTLQDDAGHHNSALFVQWVPYQPAGSSWDAERDRYAAHLLEVADRFAPGTSDLVVDTFALAPADIETHFGMTRGHIHHIDNSFGFSDRVPYTTPIDGLYMASAGCHPAGSVIGCAGHNSAMTVLEDLGLDATGDD